MGFESAFGDANWYDGRNVVIANQTGQFFDHVLCRVDVTTTAWDGDRKDIVFGLNLKHQTSKQRFHRSDAQGHPDACFNRAQRDNHLSIRFVRYTSDRFALKHVGTRKFLQEGCCTVQCPCSALGVDAFFKATRRFTAQFQALRCFTNVNG